MEDKLEKYWDRFSYENRIAIDPDFFLIAIMGAIAIKKSLIDLKCGNCLAVPASGYHDTHLTKTGDRSFNENQRSFLPEQFLIRHGVAMVKRNTQIDREKRVS